MKNFLLAIVTGLLFSCNPTNDTNSFAFEEATVAELQNQIQSGALTAVELVSAYLERIALLDQSEGGVHSIIEINPDALQIAAELYDERASGKVR